MEYPDNYLFDVPELSEYLKFGKTIVYRMAKNGEIPALKIGGKWRFVKSAIDEWILEQAELNIRKQKK